MINACFCITACLAPPTVSKNLLLCSLHFTTDSFRNKAQFNVGFSERLRLDHAVLNLLDMMLHHTTSQVTYVTLRRERGTASSSGRYWERLQHDWGLKHTSKHNNNIGWRKPMTSLQSPHGDWEEIERLAWAGGLWSDRYLLSRRPRAAPSSSASQALLWRFP